MDRLFSFIIGPGDSRIGGGDSFTDRLNSRHTVFFLGILALVLTTLQWLGSVPIACFCPAHFEDSHVEFTNRACWTQNTYYLPITTQRIPKENKAYISYYQWVALALISQAVLFYVPRPLWQVLSKKSGISVSTVTDASIHLQNTLDPKVRDSIRKYITNHMGRFLVDLTRRQLMANRLQTFFISLYGNYLIIAYCIIKLLYIGNAVGQIIALNHFLDAKSYMYGLTVLTKMMSGEDWSTSERFPRITLCDIHIRRPGNIHNYTIQCSLPLNLFNEIIYIAVWFWIVIVGIATVCSLLQWIYLSFFISMQVKYITARLIALSALKPEDEDNSVDQFVRSYLRRDGLFIIQMVAKNCSDIIAATIVTGLFEHYKSNRRIMTLTSRDKYLLKKSELKKELHQGIVQCTNSLFPESPKEEKKSEGSEADEVTNSPSTTDSLLTTSASAATGISQLPAKQPPAPLLSSTDPSSSRDRKKKMEEEAERRDKKKKDHVDHHVMGLGRDKKSKNKR